MGLPDIEGANRNALQRLLDAEPVLVDLAPAWEMIPELEEGVLLHAGPPIEWDEMCGPMEAAILGAIRYQGWATGEEDARSLASSGAVRFHPNHNFAAVGPMTGITSPSMPVFVVENGPFGNRAFCTVNEGLGKVLRFGANDDAVLEKLEWIGSTLAPVLRQGILSAGGIPLRPLIARALGMGDELHQRNVAATSLFLREIAPHLARVSTNSPLLGDVMGFIAGNDQFS